jgi:hypothetical protein
MPEIEYELTHLAYTDESRLEYRDTTESAGEIDAESIWSFLEELKAEGRTPISVRLVVGTIPTEE